MKKFSSVVVFIVLILTLIYVPFSYFRKSNSGVSMDSGKVSLESEGVSMDSEKLIVDSEKVSMESGEVSLDSEKVSLESGQYTNNPYPYEPPLIIGNTELCKNSHKLDWLFYVYSLPTDFEGRELLRNTWANPKLFKDISFKVIFVLGGTSSDVQQKLEEEHGKSHDLVQGDFVDSLYNLTLKAVLALRWIATYCPDVPYAIKADGDVFVDPFQVADLLRGYPSYVLPSNDNVRVWPIYCNLWEEGQRPILRKNCKKLCAKYDEFPGADYYPQHCSGSFYVLPGALIKSLYENSKSTRYFFGEDVYVTGLLIKKIKDLFVFLQKSDIDPYRPPITVHLLKHTTQPIDFGVASGDAPYLKLLWNVLLYRLTDSHKALLQQDVSMYRAR